MASRVNDRWSRTLAPDATHARWRYQATAIVAPASRTVTARDAGRSAPAIFDAAVAARYEHWYATPAGRRAEAGERALLAAALAGLPARARVLEVGCGTGRFSRWLAQQGYRVIGVDRSAPMLAVARRLAAGPWVQADAATLPLADGSCAAVVFVTALEFMPDPLAALREAWRVATERVAIVALSAWSAGWWLRSWRGRESPTIGRARRWAPPVLARLVHQAAAPRPVRVAWRSALPPRGLPDLLPWGEVVGVTAQVAARR